MCGCVDNNYNMFGRTTVVDGGRPYPPPLQRDAGRWVIIENRKLSDIREAEVYPPAKRRRQVGDIREAEVE